MILLSVLRFWRLSKVFSSNVQPRRTVREVRKEPWYCHRCDLEHPAYYSKCPKCGDHRPH